jgi:hypothetical protein
MKPTASLAVSTLALIVAITGAAGAAAMIDGHSIENHSITSRRALRVSGKTAVRVKLGGHHFEGFLAKVAHFCA